MFGTQLSLPELRWPARLVSILVIMALLAIALPQPVLAVTCVSRYTVKAGDTVSAIADSFKITVTELTSANSLTSPFTIFVGQVLCIPAGATTTTTTTSSSSSSKSETISAEREGNKLVVKLANLKKKTSYYLRVQSLRRNNTSWFKLGTFTTSKTGTASTVRGLPKTLRDEPAIRVCVKHALNDTVQCAVIDITQ
jgi:LysM repeat protein